MDVAFDVHAPGQGIAREIAKLLEGLPAYVVWGRPSDWRFQALRLKNDKGWIVIGVDAFIQAWLDENTHL